MSFLSFVLGAIVKGIGLVPFQIETAQLTLDGLSPNLGVTRKSEFERFLEDGTFAGVLVLVVIALVIALFFKNKQS